MTPHYPDAFRRLGLARRGGLLPSPRRISHVCPDCAAGQAAFWVCTIFMAEPISAATSVMLLGTMSVVVASDATWL